MSDHTTTTDRGENSGWRITDPLVRLRELGSERDYNLAPTLACDWILGSSVTCSIQLHDGEGRISRQHARLVRTDELWSIHDLHSKNGLWVDGARRPTSVLSPGTEIGIGGVTLIAESHELVELRELLRRMLGKGAERALDVDGALRSVRDAAILRLSLVLCGEGDLVPIARRFHAITLGAERPFVVYPGDGPALPLLATAETGTLYLPAKRLPPDLTDVIAGQRVPGKRVRLVVGSPTQTRARSIAMMLGRVGRITLTPLGARRDELPQIVGEYIEEAAHALDQATSGVRARDLAALCKHDFDGLADIEESARRLVALRKLGVTAGAAAVGITHGALSKWAQRRGLHDGIRN